jgi:hypothetical protein
MTDSSEVETKDSFDHWVCCIDDNVALCGTDVSNQPWVDIDGDCSCQSCSDLLFCTICPVYKVACTFVGDVNKEIIF